MSIFSNRATDQELLHERNYTLPKPIENYIMVTSEIFALSALLLKAKFNIANQPVLLQQKFQVKNIEDLKYKLTRAYLLLREFLISSNLNLKTLVDQYNEVQQQVASFSSSQDSRLAKQKGKVSDSIKKIDENKNRLKNIEDFLRNYNVTREFNLSREHLMDLFDNDEAVVEYILQNLPDTAYSKGRVYRSRDRRARRDRQDNEGNSRLKLNYSMEFLLRMNALVQSQVELIKKNVELNKKSWVDLSSKIQKLSEQLNELE